MNKDEQRDELARIIMGYDIRQLTQVYVGDEANWSSSRRKADDIISSAWLDRVKRETAAEAMDEAINAWSPDPYEFKARVRACAAAIRSGVDQ